MASAQALSALRKPTASEAAAAASPSPLLDTARTALPLTTDCIAAGAGRSPEPGPSNQPAHVPKAAVDVRTIDQIYADMTAARARRRQQQQGLPADANELQPSGITASQTAPPHSTGDAAPRSGALDSGPISGMLPAAAVMAARRKRLSSSSAGMTDLQVWAQLVQAVTGGRSLDIVIADMKTARSSRASVSRNPSMSSLQSARLPRPLTLTAAASRTSSAQTYSQADPEDASAAIALRRSLDDGMTPAEDAGTVTVMDERLMRTMSGRE